MHVVADTHMLAAPVVSNTQAGDLRWRPHATYARQWAAAQAVLDAEAAAAAAFSRRTSGATAVSGDGDGGDGGRWGPLAGFKASADGWMHRIRDTGARLLRPSAAGGLSGRGSSIWGALSSRATSKALSTAVSSRVPSETAGDAGGDGGGGGGGGGAAAVGLHRQ
jgi:hypothetical protein